MKSLKTGCFFALALLISVGFTLYAQNRVPQTIPSGGNAYLVKGKVIAEDNQGRWEETDDCYLFSFHADRSCQADLSVNLSVPEGTSRLQVTAGKKTFKINVSGPAVHPVKIGKITILAGYNLLRIQGVRKEGAIFAALADLVVQPADNLLVLNYVRDNQENRFYWGRRGPSVHLSYEIPKGVEAEYFYNEITVPEGMDPVGSYFMANGFGEGYFGIQVNGPEERRVLFSVWSPFKTDHPGEIPEAEKIKLLAKGEGVHAGEFGNEGSGGQSYLRYPWKAGTTYRFLLKGTPDTKGNTVFSAWFFAPEVANWKLIASFRRPKTDHYLTRLHSFLENFEDTNGYLTRRGGYANMWCRDKAGQWYPLTKARFTGDDIARRGYRLDYAGGKEGKGFFLKNGGFFNDSTTINTRFELDSAPVTPPDVDPEKLP